MKRNRRRTWQTTTCFAPLGFRTMELRWSFSVHVFALYDISSIYIYITIYTHTPINPNLHQFRNNHEPPLKNKKGVPMVLVLFVRGHSWVGGWGQKQTVSHNASWKSSASLKTSKVKVLPEDDIITVVQYMYAGWCPPQVLEIGLLPMSSSTSALRVAAVPARMTLCSVLSLC